MADVLVVCGCHPSGALSAAAQRMAGSLNAAVDGSSVSLSKLACVIVVASSCAASVEAGRAESSDTTDVVELSSVWVSDAGPTPSSAGTSSSTTGCS